MEALSFLWNELIIRPMLNAFVVLYDISFEQAGLAIIALTILVRLITLPLTLKQLRQMRAMTSLQPKLQEIQQRYAKDRARISQETMRLYRESGISPLGCLGPMVVQMPILIGLYQVLIKALFTNPDDLVGLGEKLYSWIPFFTVHAAAPLNSGFLWLDLAQPDPSPFIIPLLVAVSTWVQQKMTLTPTADPRQQANQTMMLWMMPIMLGFFAISLPSGLSIYWIVSNVIGVAIQYFITGWGPLFPLFPKPASAPAATSASAASASAPAAARDAVATKERAENERSDNERPNRRRSHRARPERAGRRNRRGRS